MVRISNVLITLLSLLTGIVAISFFCYSLYLVLHGQSECQKFFQKVLLIFAAVLLVISVLGCIGACCRVSAMLWIYAFVISLLILGMVCFTIFAFIVTNHGAGKVVSGKGYKEYRLGDYSHWLQNHVVNGKNWGKFKSCLVDTNLCMKLSGDARTSQAFYKRNLSPTQSGCCKPPTYCGYTFQNATFWVAPKSGPTASDSDCLTWSNKQDTLCYDCKSCKAGILANMQDEWKKIFAINICIFLFLTIVHCIGTCAYRGTKADYRYKGYKGYRGYH